MTIPIKERNPKGFHQRYYIEKLNGEPIDEGAEYFVLRLDEGGDPEHVQACRAAIIEYARIIRHFVPGLAHDLIERYGQ